MVKDCKMLHIKIHVFYGGYLKTYGETRVCIIMARSHSFLIMKVSHHLLGLLKWSYFSHFYNFNKYKFKSISTHKEITFFICEWQIAKYAHSHK